MSKEQRDFFYGKFNNENMKGNWRNMQPVGENRKIMSYSIE
jgi:hypothetical protein